MTFLVVLRKKSSTFADLTWPLPTLKLDLTGMWKSVYFSPGLTNFFTPQVGRWHWQLRLHSLGREAAASMTVVFVSNSCVTVS